MASGNHYQVNDISSFLGQTCINVWMFLATGSDATAQHVEETYVAGFVTPMIAIQSDNLTHNQIQVVNQDDLTDFVNTFITEIGTISGDALPSFVAYEFFFSRLTRASRNGWKRVAGVPEAGQANGVLATGYANQMDNIALALGAGLDHPTLDCHIKPLIWRRPKGTTPGAYFDVASVQGRHSVTTQNSRKGGRGI